ncbi:DUF4209 domain-containing protein [Myxococcota bacterium]|nr:DUF4209 domain-containing protein [Myxococcota bacterium]MBU1379447.1 DUF4209 domain-containing protein [Myxococcota bacterium]MBU1496150.1 DUF4209 domain-containing protein [Myxococcota bacterium]
MEKRYSGNTVISKNDFNWQECLGFIDNLKRCSDLYSAFAKAARVFKENGDLKKSKIYWLLSDACSLNLNNDNNKNPFVPMLIFQNTRSAMLEDFKKEDLDFFEDILPQLKLPCLESRLADLIKTADRNRSYKLNLQAIDAYRKTPLETEEWIRDGRDCWYRAIYLAKIMGNTAEKYLNEMETEIIDAFRQSDYSNGLFLIWMADLLLVYNLGKNENSEIAIKLENSAEELIKKSDYHTGILFYEACRKWSNYYKDKYHEITCRIADSFKDFGEKCETPQGWFLAHENYQNAMKYYREIPAEFRDQYDIEQKLSETHQRMNNAAKMMLDQMKPVFSPLDVSEILPMANKTISGKKPGDALLSFVNIAGPLNINFIRKNSEEFLNNNLLSNLCPSTHFSSEGNVISKSEGILNAEKKSEEHPKIVESIIQTYGIHITVNIYGLILPALNILNREHNLREIDFQEVTKWSPIIPPGREFFFSKGIYAGYNYDFITSLSILVPQLENLVRYHLKNAGAKTSTIDSNGIENENGLSTLVKLPEFKTVFSEELQFEIKYLFCTSPGPNLRNEISHGLMSYNSFSNVYSIYAWWFIFKLVFNNFYTAVSASKNASNNREVRDV